MKGERRVILSIAWVILGAVLLGLGIAGVVDSFWSGMGSGLIVVGILQVVRFVRFRKNADYRDKVTREVEDERNHFIRNKAWAWTGYLFVLIVACASIVLRIMGQELLSLAASYAVCLMILLYWVSYLVLRKKY